ncbi:uncharacterized protein N7511_011106 [Penicillium nucicola]|uniref:uncharacterized protein n=1 Tax=Penicillium nucicola TaxID=1850975 RepID=UPI0025453131|nr:uncharacterized protein N7511_011106 [Penicillium nucicola]KAJ5742705.1 hypothetical protein N7511_011106 [Penicillium nucicola]
MTPIHPPLSFLAGLITALLVLTFLNRASQSSNPGIISPSGEYKPITLHSENWKTWLNPHQSALPSAIQTSENKWNILHHLGGNGPWIKNIHHGVASSLETPEGCSIDQVHLVCTVADSIVKKLSRHGERYPTQSVGNRHLKFLRRVHDTGYPLNGSLAFIQNWTYLTDDPENDFGELTRTGPFAGTLSSFTTGVRFRTRYEHLIPKYIQTRLWASDSGRVIETARHFASGFFGLDWETSDKAELQIIPETFERGADTLTPGDTCYNYLEDIIYGHDNGQEMLARFQKSYTPGIANRLIHEGNFGLKGLSSTEIYAMQEMCGFEIMVRGSSPWCEVFTKQEWEHFEYARDLIHYYRAGPGNPYSGAMGWLWLNATTELLRDGPDAGSLFFSFVHDGDIAPLITTLGVLGSDKEHLPTTHVVADRMWRISSILPMGARVTLERMSCSGNDEPYVRVNINDGIMPLPLCKSGPGEACPLTSFVNYVHRRKSEVGEFAEICGLQGDIGSFTFLHQK